MSTTSHNRATSPTPKTSIRALAQDPDYLVKALHEMSRIHSAPDAAQLLQRVQDAIASLGLSGCLYVVTIPEGSESESTFSVFACDPCFERALHANDLPLAQPWRRTARTHSTPMTSAEVSSDDPHDTAFIDLARQYGFKSTLIIPASGARGLCRYEMLCVGSEEDHAFEGEDVRVVWMLAQALAGEMHDWFCCHLRNGLQAEVQLHPSEIELLRMEWNGHGTKDICQRTGLSIASIDSRFQRINLRLNCQSRSTAARKAAEYGLL